MSYFVYILWCKNKSLYTGIATDVKRRFTEHQKGTGAKYTRSHHPVAVVYSKKFRTKSSALKRELKIKKLSRAEKLKLISS